MKKLYLFIFLSMILCLTACEADKKNKDSGNSNVVSDSGMEKDTKEISDKTDFELTEQGKNFLKQMCKKLSNFDSQNDFGNKFWHDFLFYSYNNPPLGAETIVVNIQGIDQTFAKISLHEAEAYAKLVLGVDLPYIQPSFNEMTYTNTSFYYQDGYYYIQCSDILAYQYQYTFADCKESDNSITVTYIIDNYESNIGMVYFTIKPEDNDNGFIITSKRSELSE